MVKVALSSLSSDIDVKKDKLFDKDNADVLKNLKDPATFKRLSNASRILSNWATLMNKVNADGCGNASPIVGDPVNPHCSVCCHPCLRVANEYFNVAPMSPGKS